MPKKLDITGQTFSKLTVIGYYGMTKHGKSLWACQCSCNRCNIIITVGAALKSGNTTSCGCARLDAWELLVTHGLSETPEGVAWYNMIGRCTKEKHPQWEDYGGRGIKVCEEWLHSPVYFYEHIGPKPSKKHSLDRINNEGNYEPGNVRWATMKEQALNKRDNVYVTIQGVTRRLMEWADDYGLTRSTLSRRIKEQWPEHELLIPTMEFKEAGLRSAAKRKKNKETAAQVTTTGQ